MILKIVFIILSFISSTIHTLQCYSCNDCNDPFFSSHKKLSHACNGTLLGILIVIDIETAIYLNNIF